MGMTASVVGATGLVGSALVSQLCRDDEVDAVHVLVRRALPAAVLACSPKLVQHVIDFDQSPKVSWPYSDVLFCCLGTTIRTAGSKEAFRAVDFDYVVGSAQRARNAGASGLVVVSALGANPKSKVFYNRTKGEMETGIAMLGFNSVVMVRPSLLQGVRAESRTAERLALAASKIITPILPARYRPVPAESVAHAMIAAGKRRPPGITIIESEQIPRLA